MRTSLFLLFLMLAVTGCGYKGPLYLAKDKPVAGKPKPAPAQPAVTPATEESPAQP